jgi:hypothetical protein
MQCALEGKGQHLFDDFQCAALAGKHSQALAACLHCIVVIFIVTLHAPCTWFFPLNAIIPFVDVCHLALLISNDHLWFLPMPLRRSLRIAASFSKPPKSTIGGVMLNLDLRFKT